MLPLADPPEDLLDLPDELAGRRTWVSTKRCSHAVAVAERHYAGLVKIDGDPETLEAAMGIEDLVDQILDVTAARLGRTRKSAPEPTASSS